MSDAKDAEIVDMTTFNAPADVIVDLTKDDMMIIAGCLRYLKENSDQKEQIEPVYRKIMQTIANNA